MNRWRLQGFIGAVNEAYTQWKKGVKWKDNKIKKYRLLGTRKKGRGRQNAVKSKPLKVEKNP